MPTLAQVRNFVDARLANLWTNQVVPRQNAFFAAHGRYWQGLVTSDLLDLPNNPDSGDPGVLETVPLVLRHPTDQPETWTDAGINLGATIPMALEIHTYDGPLGKGYVGYVWARWAGELYMRCQNFGPETWRTLAWHRVQDMAA
jgi:hypothetical protein